MTGFYSKDFILESAYGQFFFSGTVVYFIATIGAMFTTLYSVKVLYLTFLTNPNGPIVNYKQAHEGNIFMTLPLIILAVFSIFFGYITKDIFIGLGSGFFADNSIFIHPTHEIMLDTEFAVPTLFKLLPLIFTISLTIIAIVLSEFPLFQAIIIKFKLSRLGYNIFGFFNQRFLIEMYYNKYITNLVLKLGGQTTKVLDKGSVELLGPYGLEKTLLNLSENIASLNRGVITSYALYILTGLIIYILIPNILLIDNILFLLLVLCLLSLSHNNNNRIPLNKQDQLLNGFPGIIKTIKKLYTNTKRKIFSKKFWYRVLFLFIFGYIIRLAILTLGGVNVIKDHLHPASVAYWFVMAIATLLSESELDKVLPDKLFMGAQGGSRPGPAPGPGPRLVAGPALRTALGPAPVPGSGSAPEPVAGSAAPRPAPGPAQVPVPGPVSEPTPRPEPDTGYNLEDLKKNPQHYYNNILESIRREFREKYPDKYTKTPDTPNNTSNSQIDNSSPQTTPKDTSSSQITDSSTQTPPRDPSSTQITGNRPSMP